MINGDEDGDGMYDGGSGLKDFYSLFEVIVTSLILFSKKTNNLYKYVVLINYSCLVIIVIELYHYCIMT